MKNLLIPISIAGLSVSFTVLPTTKLDRGQNKLVFASSPGYSSYNDDVTTSLYTAMDLEEYGLSKEAFTYAYKGYQALLAKNRIERTGYLTICDFSQSSKQKRFYILDLTNNKVLTNTYVAHGKNSGGEYATRFSNRPASLQSSLGFYITRGTYIGEHGLSLKIDGMDIGFNEKAMARNIVIHGAAYVDENRVRQGMYMGRSWGCPAVSQKESAQIISTIKNGTCLFIYHPDRNYLQRSKILNG